jgi:hypothetical protein
MKSKAVWWSLLASSLVLLTAFYFSQAQEGHSNISPAPIAQTTVRASEHPSNTPSAERVEAGEDDPMAREEWELRRHGFHLGVPRQAYANAMN